jgi:preprotein translocase subunit SecE
VFRQKISRRKVEEELPVEEEELEEDDEEVEEQPEKRGKREERREKGRPTRRDASARKNPRSNNPIIRYFQETAVELRKVTWPTRETAVRLTLIVLASTGVAALFLGLFDLGLQQLAGLLLGA